MSAIPEEYTDLLAWDTKSFAHIATIGPDGAPQNNPVWFDWDGELLTFSLTTTRRKYRNISEEPRVALSIIDPANPYRYLEIRGQVVDTTPDPDIDFISRLAKKYLGKDRYPNHRPGDERVVLTVRPEHTTAMG